MTLIRMRTSEAEISQPITVKDENGCNICLGFAVAGDTTIVLKCSAETCIVLTLTCADFAICAAIITWTVTAIHMTALGTGRFVGYTHPKSVASGQEEVGRFDLEILTN